jgi:hypothetical protein
MESMLLYTGIDQYKEAAKLQYEHSLMIEAVARIDKRYCRLKFSRLWG